jgi:hypothetical protein
MHWLLDLHAVAVAAAPMWGRLQTSTSKRKPAASSSTNQKIYLF